MIILNDMELEKKNTKNLLYIKRKLTPFFQKIGYCEMCRDFCGHVELSLYEKEHQDYMLRIKKILATREHIDRDKAKGKRA